MPNLKNPVAPQELLAVAAALKVGIFDALYQKPATIDELARDLSLDRRALWTVKEALVDLGYLTESDVLKLTPESIDLFYNEESENYLGYAIIHTFNVIKSWTGLPEVLKSGHPLPRERDKQDIKGFMAAMKRSAKEVVTELVQICLAGLPREPKVLDIGGGPLNFARPFARAGAVVTVQDVPEVCSVMEKTLLPGEKIKFVPGDFTKGIVAGDFDLIFLGNICHIYGPKENKILFKRVFDSLVKGGRIAILDFVRGISPRAALFGINMLVNTETGGTWTMDEYTSWLKEAGFCDIGLHNLSVRQIITASKEN
ncbi:O-methyltransferase family 2 [Desulfotomaculum nigrificans CO-1-SRB]|uniref:O-methyltransferase family 2 n=1 Tax=Desulfotomaculum nigrificans (strain DSM 14880 / VKM B-2319 / CO-1-SRB) TaxID=868595 RepID=F6B3U7_DESCC|nr:methyltransferase [Desulfotomaculum nigrificans]AEF92912.1 O-methyltransferase family 2 [Desulfotomaculum nigrificans CO-1-SRB]